MNRTAILIPCYNEEKTVMAVVKDFRENLPDCDIYVYDNNSTDRTAELVQEAQKTDDKLFLCRERRQGKGNVVRTMFREIEADCYIMVDGDDTYPASFAKEFENLVIEEKADMVVGDRLSSTYFTENKRRFHGVGNKLVRFLVNRIFKADLHDIMTGARAFSRDFVKSYAVFSRGFEIETDMSIFALDNNFRIVERPIEYRDRPSGSESKLNTYSDGLKVLNTILRLFRDTRPMQFFTILSVIMMIVAICVFIPIMVSYSETGVVDRFPTLIVDCSLATCAFLNFFVGVTLSAIGRFRKTEFERFLTLINIKPCRKY